MSPTHKYEDYNYGDYYFSIYSGYGEYGSGLIISKSGAPNAIRPVIVLKPGLEYKTGDGTAGNAYQVK